MIRRDAQLPAVVNFPAIRRGRPRDAPPVVNPCRQGPQRLGRKPHRIAIDLQRDRVVAPVGPARRNDRYPAAGRLHPQGRRPVSTSNPDGWTFSVMTAEPEGAWSRQCAFRLVHLVPAAAAAEPRAPGGRPARGLRRHGRARPEPGRGHGPGAGGAETAGPLARHRPACAQRLTGRGGGRRRPRGVRRGHVEVRPASAVRAGHTP
jgi:hypothetical protein